MFVEIFYIYFIYIYSCEFIFVNTHRNKSQSIYLLITELSAHSFFGVDFQSDPLYTGICIYILYIYYTHKIRNETPIISLKCRRKNIFNFRYPGDLCSINSNKNKFVPDCFLQRYIHIICIK